MTTVIENLRPALVQAGRELLTDTVLDALAEEGFVVLKDSFTLDTLCHLNTYFEDLKSEGEFRSAGIGTTSEINKSIRKDHIFWLANDTIETRLAPIYQFLTETQSVFNRNFYVGINTHECHFAEYGEGAFYKKHIDQPQGTDNRVFTFILYLNENWQAADGGQLRMYLKNQETLDVLPELGTLVLFRSDLIPHEVLVAHRSRRSLTGWFLRGDGVLR